MCVTFGPRLPDGGTLNSGPLASLQATSLALKMPLFDTSLACLVPLQLNLSLNDIDAEGAQPLADALRVNASLMRLDVSSNYLDRGGHGVKMLRDAVRGHQGFTLLDDDND